MSDPFLPPNVPKRGFLHYAKPPTLPVRWDDSMRDAMYEIPFPDAKFSDAIPTAGRSRILVREELRRSVGPNGAFFFLARVDVATPTPVATPGVGVARALLKLSSYAPALRREAAFLRLLDPLLLDGDRVAPRLLDAWRFETVSLPELRLSSDQAIENTRRKAVPLTYALLIEEWEMTLDVPLFGVGRPKLPFVSIETLVRAFRLANVLGGLGLAHGDLRAKRFLCSWDPARSAYRVCLAGSKTAGRLPGDDDKSRTHLPMAEPVLGFGCEPAPAAAADAKAAPAPTSKRAAALRNLMQLEADVLGALATLPVEKTRGVMVLDHTAIPHVFPGLDNMPYNTIQKPCPALQALFARAVPQTHSLAKVLAQNNQPLKALQLDIKHVDVRVAGFVPDAVNEQRIAALAATLRSKPSVARVRTPVRLPLRYVAVRAPKADRELRAKCQSVFLQVDQNGELWPQVQRKEGAGGLVVRKILKFQKWDMSKFVFVAEVEVVVNSGGWTPAVLKIEARESSARKEVGFLTMLQSVELDGDAVVPRLIDSWVCPTAEISNFLDAEARGDSRYKSHFILMEKWDGSMEQLLWQARKEGKKANEKKKELTRPAPSLDAAVRMFRLAYLLGQFGIVHGDLKADQFLYRWDAGRKAYRVCVADFGFAGRGASDSTPAHIAFPLAENGWLSIAHKVPGCGQAYDKFTVTGANEASAMNVQQLELEWLLSLGKWGNESIVEDGWAVVGIDGAPYDRSRYCPYALEVRRDRAQSKVDRARHVRLPYDALRVRILDADESKDVDMKAVPPAPVSAPAPASVPANTSTPASVPASVSVSAPKPAPVALTKPGQPLLNLAAPPASQASRQVITLAPLPGNK
jgi:hypothetical protein